MSFPPGPQAPDHPADDRRRHPRVQIKAYGHNHVCQFQRFGRRHPASLVDISPGGARLALADDLPPIARGDALTLNTRLCSSLEDLEAVPSTVRWIQKNEFGVSFDRMLGLGIFELQQILAR